MESRDLLSIDNVSKKDISNLIALSLKIKKHPHKYCKKLHNKTLLMLFEKPSLRTHLSFEVGAFQLGGNAIFFDMHTAPLGSGKETLADSAKTMSHYVDVIVARMYEHDKIQELAKHATVPIINGLTNYTHPCQALSDLLTVQEKFKKLKGINFSYFGDGNNNVTHSLMLACPKMGINLTICSPSNKKYQPATKVINIAKNDAKKNRTKFTITSDTKQAAKNADVIYTDSWMSYHIPKSQQKQRAAALKKYQVNQQIMRLANKKAVFMHCLPALRGLEVSADVMDSKQSIVFIQAENRMHMEKAILLWLLNKA